MKWIVDIDSWEEILVTITRNKTRSFLTAFGVFWGIFMLITLMGGGNGLHKLVLSQFSGIVNNSCFIISNRTSEAYKGFRKGRSWSLTIDDIDILKAKIPEIDLISPVIMAGWNTDNTVYGDKTYTSGVKGVMGDYKLIEDHQNKYGRFINEVDVKEKRKVCYIGERIYEAFFQPGEDPLGKYLRIHGVYYQIIGVEENASNLSLGGNAEETIIIPFTTMQTYFKRGKKIDVIGLTSKPGVSIQTIQKKAEAVLKETHMIAPHDEQAIYSINVEKMFKQLENISLGVSLLTWIVGMGTLLAGVIGVSNIMMVTVKERTGEIGIRRAIGAKPGQILGQILSESMVLTCLAGISGICLGVGILQLVNIGIGSNTNEDPGFQISFWTAIGTTIILLTLGSLAGLAPAYRAMNIKPIEAIREE